MYFHSSQNTWNCIFSIKLYALIVCSTFSKGFTEALAVSYTYFYVNTDIDFNRSALSEPWKADKDVSCVRSCMVRFQDLCKDVVYNPNTLDCQPVNPNSVNDVSLTLQAGDVLYSKDEAGTALRCDIAAGYGLFTAGEASACLLANLGTQNYFAADANCGMMNATLFAPNTLERLALFESVLDGNPLYHTAVWIGLNKFTGNWAWNTGEILESNLAAALWASTQPQNIMSETCAVYMYYTGTHNVNCVNSYIYFCEQNY